MTKSLGNLLLPNCLLYTRKLHVPFLSPDLYEEIENIPKIAYISLNTIYEKLKVFEHFNRPISEYTLFDKECFLFQNDPIDNVHKSAFNDREVSVWAVGGRLNLSMAQYKRTVNLTHPTYFQSPVDNETAKFNHSNRKKCLKTVQRSLNFLNEFSNINELSFVSLTGGNITEIYGQFIDKLSNYKYSGLILDGIFFEHSNTDQNAETFQMIEEVIKKIRSVDPKSPIMLASVYQPGDIVQSVKCGVDLFDGSLPYRLARAGISWNYDPKTGLSYSAFPDSNKFYSPTDGQRDSFTEPLQEGCLCYTCRTHNTAYVNHLHEVSEMLAQILLMIHNSTVVYRFFKDLRTCLETGTFEEFYAIHRNSYFPQDLLLRDNSAELLTVAKKKT